MLLTILLKKSKVFWDVFIFFLATFSAIEKPLWLIFRYDLNTTMYVFEWLISIAFLADTIILLKSEIHIFQIDWRFSHYSWHIVKWIILDLLSSIPFELLIIYKFLPENLGFLSIFRFLRIIKLTDITLFKNKWGVHELSNPSKMRLLFLTFWFAISAHWIACGWMGIGGGIVNADPITQYIRAIYWSVTTITTIGYGDITPKNNNQTIYTMCVMLFGAGLYGYVVGNIANLLSNIDTARSNFLEKIDRINTFIRYKKIPQDLQETILTYYDYLWKNQRGFDETFVLSELPPSIRKKVSLYLNSEIVRKVPILKDASEDLITRIVMNLKPVVYMKGDFIFKRGEIGDNLYFISSGSVEIVAADNRTVYAVLGEGNFFGEVALLTNAPRNASIRAMEFCDLYYLDKKTFDYILESFPDFAKKIKELARQRRRKR